MVAHICHPNYMGSINRKIMVQASLGIKLDPHLKNKQSNKGWEGRGGGQR
jgi:hypothetical protein